MERKQVTLEMQKPFSKLAQADVSAMITATMSKVLWEEKLQIIISKISPCHESHLFLEESQLSLTPVLKNFYNSLAIESLHVQQLGIVMQLKERMFKLLAWVRWSDDKARRSCTQRYPLTRLEVSVLCGLKFLLAEIDQEAGVPVVLVDFSSKGCSM